MVSLRPLRLALELVLPVGCAPTTSAEGRPLARRWDAVAGQAAAAASAAKGSRVLSHLVDVTRRDRITTAAL